MRDLALMELCPEYSPLFGRLSPYSPASDTAHSASSNSSDSNPVHSSSVHSILVHSTPPNSAFSLLYV